MYPVLLDVGRFELRAYGVNVALAIVTAIGCATREARRRGLDPAVVTDGAPVIVGAGLVAARLYVFRADPPVLAGLVAPQAVSALLVTAGVLAWSRRPPRLTRELADAR